MEDLKNSTAAKSDDVQGVELTAENQLDTSAATIQTLDLQMMRVRSSLKAGARCCTGHMTGK